MRITKQQEELLNEIDKYKYTQKSIQKIINVALEGKDEQFTRNRDHNGQAAERQSSNCEVCD